LHKDDFVISQLKAWEGALARVSESFDGWFLSPQFPTFRTVPERLNIFYLDWYCKQSKVWEQLKSKSRGMGARRDSVSIKKFLSLEIPLPPLEEQRRIVARVEELVGKIEEVRSLRQKMIEQCDALCRSIIFSNSSNSILTPLHELVKLRSTDITVSPEKTYNFAGVYCFGRGLFRQQNQKGIEFSYKNLTQLKAGNFVYPKLMAWEGALGVVPPELDGCVVSPEFPVFEVNENRVLPEVLDIYFRTPSVWDILGQISTGTNVRRRRLNPSNFLEFKMPLPSMQTQEQLRKVKRKVDTMKQLREEAIKELDALLPSILDKAFKGEL
jgi:type I restriction enzyme S subunit